MKEALTVEVIRALASEFAKAESSHVEPSIYGVTDGKTLGTYIEHKFRDFLGQRHSFDAGSSAKGIDFPSLDVDVKTTSIKQPQSSCPYQSARQKIYGLGYSLLVFVYNKTDDDAQKTGRLEFEHVVFVECERTADFQMTTGLRQILSNNGNADDLVAFMLDKNLPVDEIQAARLAEELLTHAPEVGYLTISNALQWRLQYARAIEQAGSVDGIIRLR